MSKNHPIRRRKEYSSERQPYRKSHVIEVVGVTGFEPVTLRLSSACSNQLSYTPLLEAQSVLWNPSLVELRRLELPTYSLQSYRSTN